MATSRHRPNAAQRRSTYKHVFVDTLPDKLDEGVLYVCVRYATSAHNCFCGCGREVVTPIHPTKWRMTFDGAAVSLLPSVGSWSLPCRSHYVLRSGRVAWAESFSDDKVQAARSRDLASQENYFGRNKTPPASSAPIMAEQKIASRWQKISDWWHGK